MRTPLFIILTTCLLPGILHAQYTSRLGRFQVDEKKGCAPFTVTVTNLLVGKCTPGDPCDFDYEGNSQFVQNSFMFTYNQPGTYKLTVLYQTIGTDDITITVTNNIQPAFEIYSCSGNQVDVKVTDTNYNQYIINFNDGSPVTVVPSGSLATATHAYATSGNKSITVRGRNLNADDNCDPMTQNFTAVNNLPTPVLNQVLVLNSTNAKIDFTGTKNIQYRLEVAANGSPSFQLLKQLYNVTTDTVKQLNTEDNYYCFRVGAVDPCTGNVSYSNTVCSVAFDLSIQSGQNVLTWNTGPAGINFYGVERNQNSYSAVSGMSYTDIAVACGSDYCYRVTAFYANGSRSFSEEKCGTAFSINTPPSINSVSSVVTGQGVDLSWRQDSLYIVAQYEIAHGAMGGTQNFFATTSQPQFTDPAYTTEAGYCYRIKYTDICNNAALPGAEICPIRLNASLTKENYVTLSWTSYEGWQAGVASYMIEKRGADGQLLGTFSPGQATNFLDDTQNLTEQILTYLVTAKPNDASYNNSVSNAITIIKDPKLFFPTAFTPDQTGPPENELFKVFGQFVDKFEMKIFNRWGELMFVTTDLDSGWDGTFNGIPQPEGIYVFRANITDLAGRHSVKSGSVLLLRKNK